MFTMKRLWRATSRAAAPAFEPGSLPSGTRIYAVGDVHGRLDLLFELEARIRADVAAAGSCADQRWVFLGDYVDRGPDSRGVVEHLCRPPPPGFGRTLIRGNHDWWLQQFLDGGAALPWLVSGGDAALRSYGVDPRGALTTPAGVAELRTDFLRRIPVAHRRFFNGLVRYAQVGAYAFVHAGVRPGLPLAQQNAHDLMFIREPFLDDETDHGFIVVHGHTVVERPEVRRNRVAIDTGACWTGRLTALVIEPGGIRFLSTAD